MTAPIVPKPPNNTGRIRPRRSLNQTRIKANIVFVAAVVTSLVAGVTGLGPQLAFAPMLIWMLGFGAEKAQGTALRFAVIASVAAVVGGRIAPVPPSAAAARLPLTLFLANGFCLFVGATIGALILAALIPKPADTSRRRLGALLGIALMLFVVVQTAHQSGWTNPHLAAWKTLPLLFGLALVCGALTQALALPGGMLIVAALYYFGGLAPGECVTLSLFVVALAALLPASGYAKRGLVDDTYGWPAALGGLLGGAVGGLVRVHVADPVILLAYAVVAMFLLARELARMAAEA